MTLVLRNMPRYRFRYEDAEGSERVASLLRGQSVAHLNLSAKDEHYLTHLVVGIGGQPHPVFVDDGKSIQEPAAVVVEAPAVAVEAPVEAAKVAAPAMPAMPARPKAKSKKPKSKKV